MSSRAQTATARQPCLGWYCTVQQANTHVTPTHMRLVGFVGFVGFVGEPGCPVTPGSAQSGVWFFDPVRLRLRVVLVLSDLWQCEG